VRDGVIDVRVSSAGGGFLVLSEVLYPGWQARIDGGEPRPVVPAYLALQGIEVPGGDHRVTFEFAPDSRRLGAAVSLAGVLGTALLARSRRRRANPARVPTLSQVN
jgi:uncharacterized membrane protein YfhO